MSASGPLTIEELERKIPEGCTMRQGDLYDPKLFITGPASTGEAGRANLTFVTPHHLGLLSTVDSIGVLVLPDEADIPDDLIQRTALLISCDNPRLVFAKLASLFSIKVPTGIHESACISSSARIGEHCSIGPNVVIGDEVVIGDHCVIGPNTVIEPYSEINSHVTVQSNTTIGFPGFGFERDDDGFPVRFPHFGRVILESGVEIGSNTCIDRGALSDTVIGKDTKIDNLCHIAHNVHIGERTLIVGCAQIAGSCRIGDEVWIGPNATLSDGLTIGDKAVISLGSVVVRDVSPGEHVTGHFAIPHNQFLRNHVRSQGPR